MVWSYYVPNPPKETTLNAVGLIKAISIVSDKSRHSITLQLDKDTLIPAVEALKLDLFVSLPFENLQLLTATILQEKLN